MRPDRLRFRVRNDVLVPGRVTVDCVDDTTRSWVAEVGTGALAQVVVDACKAEVGLDITRDRVAYCAERVGRVLGERWPERAFEVSYAFTPVPRSGPISALAPRFGEAIIEHENRTQGAISGSSTPCSRAHAALGHLRRGGPRGPARATVHVPDAHEAGGRRLRGRFASLHTIEHGDGVAP